MRKKLSRKTLYSLATLMAILQAPGAYAKIPLTAFKNVSLCFKKDQEFYSPTLGEAALEGGLIYNIRFDGNYTHGYDQNGNRAYERDSSRDDPIWNMVNILFPSTGGSLGTDSEATSNFGRYVNDTKTVALLHNFVKAYRGTTFKSKKERTSLITKWKKDISDSLNKAPGPANKTSNTLVEHIINSIDTEKDSLYPERTTEQVISAFFAYKFNNEQDILNLLPHLDNSIVDKELIPKSVGMKDPTELQSIATKTEDYDMDDILELAVADIWGSVTPYREGSTPLSNGNTWYYERRTDTLKEKGPTFADCVEIGARHANNLFLYDSVKREFDLTHIRKYVQTHSPTNPYFKNYEAFYAAQRPNASNDGDIKTRSLFNKVVADLNDDPNDPIQIKYMKDTNELNAGFINFIHVFKKIFGLVVDPVPTTDFNAKLQWLQKSLTEFFTALNPNKTVLMDLSQLKEDGGDISGMLPIIVGDKDRNAEFSFTFVSFVGKHSQVQDLKNLKKPSINLDFTDNLKTHSTTIKNNTAEESLWLMSPNPELKAQKVHQSLYSLFNRSLQDNDARIDFLNTLNKNFNTWQVTGKKLATLKGMLANVLNDISWEDMDILRKVSPVIRDLAQILPLQDVIAPKGYYLQSDEELKNPLFNIQKITTLAIDRGISISEGIELYQSLKKLVISYGSTIQNLRLDNLSTLEMLQVRNENLKEISLENLDQLKTIDLSHTLATKIKLNNLVKLEEFDISYKTAPRLREVSLENLNQVKTIDLSHTLATKIKLNNLPKLEILKLNKIIDIEGVSLENLNQLKSIELEGIAGTLKLGSFPKLEELNLKNTILWSLEFTQEMKNVNIKLGGSIIKNTSQIKGIEFIDENKISWS